MADPKHVAVSFLAGASAAILAALGPGENNARSGDAADQAQILEHIGTIFRAYQDGDLKTIRATHSEDWKGFLGGSERMIRGIDEYMAVAEQSVANTVEGLGWELLDVDVEVHGDVAIVYYLATYSARTPAGDRHTPLRSVDIYEKRNGEWIQTGSNICSPPQNVVQRVAYARPLGKQEREDLLAAREQVWRAWFAGDEAALRDLLPAELVAVNAGEAEWQGLEQTIIGAREFAASGMTLESIEFPRTEIQAYGPVAILYTEFSLRLRDPSGAVSTSGGRATEMFVFRDGAWRNNGWHTDGMQ